MDIELFSALLRNLLNINVTRLSGEGGALADFEDKFCYNPALQPAFTARVLSPLLQTMEEGVIYGIRDDLGIRVVFFRFGGCAFLVGPYVKTEYDALRTQRVLIENRVPASYAASIQLYYSAFPIHSSLQVRGAINACIRAFTGSGEEYAYFHLHGTKEELRLPPLSRAEILDYSTLYQRYDLENRFLQTIERGDTEHVLYAYRDMNVNGLSNNRYLLNSVYQDPTVGLAMVRALARKAAERGGASLVQVNEITQRAVQRMAGAQGIAAFNDITKDMLYELTDAVRRHRFQGGNFSEPIEKTTEFLALNFSQKLSVSQLAERVGLSEAYLSRRFKKEVGATIPQYIAELRCAQAARLLKDSGIPIQEISDHVGYPDNNYFVKVFKRRYGVTPSDYRAGGEQPGPSLGRAYEV